MNALQSAMTGYAVCIFLAVSTIQADETRSSQETNITRAEIKNQIRPKNLKAATKEIEDLNTEITMMQKQIALLEATNQTLSNWVHWSHFILENRDEIAKQLQPKWQQTSGQLFALGGGEGQLREFEIEEVAFYRGLIIVPTGYFTVFSDGSGAVGRMAVAVDPAKNFAVVSCTMGDAVKTFSAQDIQKWTASQQARPVAERPKREEAFKVEITPETKNALINGGIMVGVGILTKMLTVNK